MFAKSNLLPVLICLLGTLFPLEINAQEEGNGGGKLTVHAIIAGTILIITGIIFCFLGKRFYRPTLYLTGFYLGSFSAWAALANGKPANGYAGAASDTIILAVSLAVGLFVGLLFLYFTNSAIWSLGALFGQISALFILAWASDGVIHNKIGRIALIMIMTNLGLLLTYLRRNASIILGTAFVGAYAMILGIDLFVRTGFAQSISAFMDAAHGVSYETNTRIYLTLGGTIAWFIIGLIFQLKFNNTIHFGPVVEPEPEPEAGKKERMSTTGSIA